MENEILIVNTYAYDGGEPMVICPHCKQLMTLEADEDGSILGEQYQHNCGGWSEIAQTPTRLSIDDLLPLAEKANAVPDGA